MSAEFSANLMSRLLKLDIEKPSDLLFNLPTGYDNFMIPLKNVGSLRKLQHGDSFYATLKLENVKLSVDINREKKAKGQYVNESGQAYCIVELSDGISKISGFIFGRLEPWIELKKTSTGKIVHISGKVGHKDGFTNLNGLEIVPMGDRNRIVARYRGKEKVITPQKVADSVKIALLNHSGEAVEEILDRFDQDEASILSTAMLDFHSLKNLLHTLHMPRTLDDLERALTGARYLNAYFEIRKAQAATERSPSPESAIPINRTLIADLVKNHKYTPTGDQRKAIWEIVKDLAETTPMDRLLSADVGNGKTLAYGIPAAYACSLGKNVVVLLPTEPLAGQVAKDIRDWYPQVKVHLVTAGFDDEVKQGEMLIGTTAVLTWLKNHPEWKAAFAITDEQQKMGTAQREALNSLGTHVLEATATPIPRTMAQTIFGSKKVTYIKDCPVKKSIRTRLIGNTKDDKFSALNTLRGWMQQGKRVAVIYPLVAEQQAHFFHIKAEDLKEAEKIAKLMRAASVTVQSVKPVQEASDVLTELDDSASDGFIVEIHGEDVAFNRLQKRFAKYMSESADSCRYLGARVDDDLSQKNRTTIESAAQGWEKLYPGRVAVIHGRSKRDAKGKIIEFMNNGGADILLSTTLIEIGVDIKNLHALMVVGAEKMGAFTLHQLRGRVARHGGEGDFIMMAGSNLEDIDPTARERMDLLVKYTSGDDIALYDMEQRGFGNLSAGGQAQKGFDNGLFPGLKVSPAELDHFVKQYSQRMRARTHGNSAMEMTI